MFFSVHRYDYRLNELNPYKVLDIFRQKPKESFVTAALLGNLGAKQDAEVVNDQLVWRIWKRKKTWLQIGA